MKILNNKGFTLLEVMIVVALIAIIAAIAIPAYSDYATRARRADAKSAIITLQIAQEKIRANCPFYAQNIGNSNICGANSGGTTLVGTNTSPEGYYNLSVEANSASDTSYKLVASPTGAQLDPECGNFVFEASGAVELRTNTGTVADANEIATCWQR